MAERTLVNVRLNQQQLELLDKTVARFPGTTREEILVRALREHAAAQPVVPAQAAG